MAKREQLHAEIDALPEDQLVAARIVVSQNGSGPDDDIDDDTLRALQQERLENLADELRAEGADGSEYLPELERRAASWPA